MKKQALIKEIIQVADYFDKQGMTKEADIMDRIMKKLAYSGNDPDKLNPPSYTVDDTTRNMLDEMNMDAEDSLREDEAKRNLSNITMWQILKDHTEDIAEDVDVQSRNFDPEKAKLLPKTKFKLYDDDGNLYYEGLLYGEIDFHPLDDCGMSNAGATTMKYFQNGEWKIL